MSENRYTENLRATTVEKTSIYSTMPGDAFHPSEHLYPTPELSVEQAKGEVWHVHVTFKTGFDQRQSSVFLFGKLADAQEMMKKYPIGKKLDAAVKKYPWSFQEIFDGGTSNPLGFFGAGDEDMFLCYEVISGAGFKVSGSGTTPEVEAWHGGDKLDWFKKTFGENWAMAADLEYCLNQFSTSSMVVVACKALFNYFVQHDNYSAGYFVRELEMMHGGAEQMAADAIKLRESAGRGGSRASRAAKGKRLNQFMFEIEALGDLFPRISEKAILDQAFINAIEAEPNVWKQGRGQQEQYETELRSDAEFRDRYFRIFNKTA